MLRAEDKLAVERKTGFTTYGTFEEQDDEALVIRGTVGDNIGRLILIRWSNVDQIYILDRATE